jgi:hypothetical protein
MVLSQSKDDLAIVAKSWIKRIEWKALTKSKMASIMKQMIAA